MRIVIRADASSAIGAGHVMRCMALAEEAIDSGIDVDFLCRQLPGVLAQRLTLAGASLHRLREDLPVDPATSIEAVRLADGAATAAILHAEVGAADWLVVDHYGLDASWESRVRAVAGRILAIDDFEDRRHDCDLLLNQNFAPSGGHRPPPWLPVGSTALSGPQFALLRKEFRSWRMTSLRIRSEVRRVFVFFSTADRADITGKALQALNRILDRDVHITAVTGGRLDAMVGAIPGFPENGRLRCVDRIDNIAEVMTQADLAIGSGGVNSLERCCLGLPGIVMAIAGNQVASAVNAGASGVCRFLGNADAVSIESIESTLAEMIHTDGLISEMSRRGAGMVDGIGAVRVVSALLPDIRHFSEQELGTRVTLDAATPGDRETLYEWRNAGETRAYGFKKAPFDYRSHCQWYRSVLDAADDHLLIGRVDGVRVGVLRFQGDHGRHIVSVYLRPGLAGKGYGTALLKAGNLWAARRLNAPVVLLARIRPENAASAKAFAKAGYCSGDGSLFENTIVSG